MIRKSAGRIAAALLVVSAISGAVAATPVVSAGALPTWTVTKSPGTDGLNAVSCPSATACVAVGDYETASVSKGLIESWDGTAWSVVKSADKPGTSTYLQGVSCTSATFCTAVGWYTEGALVQTFIESWNGSSWSIVSSPNDGSDDQLSAVSCISATACEAVGSYFNSSNLKESLIESWNGTAWRDSPAFGTQANWLNGISCVSSVSCVAVGRYGDELAPSKAFIESWNGTDWSGRLGPTVGSGGSVLYGVSCVSATWCEAAGVYYRPDHSGQSNAGLTLIESWHGTTWSIVKSPNPRATFFGDQLNGISCVSTTSCQTVGVWANTNSTWVTLIDAWNGSKWTTSSSPNRGSEYDSLNGVSCASAVSCKAVGTYSPNGTLSDTLVLSYG